jgi:DNA segregation ATPase FtsK/SpoIIIE-like protein
MHFTRAGIFGLRRLELLKRFERLERILFYFKRSITMNRRIEISFGILLATAVGFSACKENPPPLTKTASKEVKPQDQEPEPPVVGRITFMEKNVFCYLSDDKDWALAMVDVPVADGDVLYSDSQGRSELAFPNDTTIRLNDKTKVQLDALKGNSTALFVNSGIARVQNSSTENVVKVDTPYGQVLSKQPGAFDVYVGDSSVAVTAFKAPLQFVDGKGTQYDIKPDADSLLANEKAVVSTPRFLNARWDSWNNERDKELQVWEVNPSPYLPDQLKSDSKTLADNGDWEQVNYGGETAHYWTPRNVAPDWSPFTVGQWTSWNGEQLWVPYERFGWVTHHHGGWIHHSNRWYWRPPPRGRWRYVPWYPARVAWVHSGRHIGWVPISPYEAYYGRRYWGPRSVVYHNNIRHVEFRRYVNANRVIVVDKDRLYGVHRRYETTRDARVVKEIVNNGRAAPVVTRDVVGGNKMERHFARSGDFSRKPNSDATTELAGRRRGTGGGTATAQAPAPGIQKASIKAPDTKAGPVPAIAKSGGENKSNLPETRRELRREQKQERRLEASTGKSVKEPPGAGRQVLPQQQKQQQQVQEPQQKQQRIQQDAQQRRQQQFERQQQQQLMQDQQRAQRQQQLQAQQEQRQLAQQQQQAQRQQQQQQQREQQGQQRQSQKKAQRQQQPQQ